MNIVDMKKSAWHVFIDGRILINIPSMSKFKGRDVLGSSAFFERSPEVSRRRPIINFRWFKSTVNPRLLFHTSQISATWSKQQKRFHFKFSVLFASSTSQHLPPWRSDRKNVITVAEKVRLDNHGRLHYSECSHLNFKYFLMQRFMR